MKTQKLLVLLLSLGACTTMISAMPEKKETKHKKAPAHKNCYEEALVSTEAGRKVFAANQAYIEFWNNNPEAKASQKEWEKLPFQAELNKIYKKVTPLLKKQRKANAQEKRHIEAQLHELFKEEDALWKKIEKTPEFKAYMEAQEKVENSAEGKKLEQDSAAAWKVFRASPDFKKYEHAIQMCENKEHLI